MKVSFNRKEKMLALAFVGLTLIGSAFAVTFYVVGRANFANVTIGSGYSLVAVFYTVNGGAPVGCTLGVVNGTCTLSSLSFGDTLGINIEVQKNNGGSATPTAIFTSSVPLDFGATTYLYGNGGTSSCTPTSSSPVVVGPAAPFGCVQADQTVSATATPGSITFHLDYGHN